MSDRILIQVYADDVMTFDDGSVIHDGSVLATVPLEPTDAMRSAGEYTAVRMMQAQQPPQVIADMVWQAMLGELLK